MTEKKIMTIYELGKTARVFNFDAPLPEVISAGVFLDPTFEGSDYPYLRVDGDIRFCLEDLIPILRKECPKLFEEE